MEIKEERSSDEARQFVPPSQVDSLGEPQFTSKCIILILLSIIEWYNKNGLLSVSVQVDSQTGCIILS